MFGKVYRHRGYFSVGIPNSPQRRVRVLRSHRTSRHIGVLRLYPTTTVGYIYPQYTPGVPPVYHTEVSGTGMEFAPDLPR